MQLLHTLLLVFPIYLLERQYCTIETIDELKVLLRTYERIKEEEKITEFKVNQKSEGTKTNFLTKIVRTKDVSSVDQKTTRKIHVLAKLNASNATNLDTLQLNAKTNRTL